MTRFDFICALRDFADVLENNPQLPMPQTPLAMTWFVGTTIEEALRIRAQMEDPTPIYRSHMDHHKVCVTGTIAGLEAQLYVSDTIAILDQIPKPGPRIDNRLGELA